MATITDVEEFVEDNPEICDTGHPSSPDLIHEAENFLGLKFPKDYQDFLSRWGTLAIGPLEFYGITGRDFESSSVPNAIWFTKKKRDGMGLPNQLIILCDNNGDEYYCLDTSDPSMSRVVVWDAISRRIASVKADSLFDFILNEASDII